jgi:AraC family transcriptional activator of pobA
MTDAFTIFQLDTARAREIESSVNEPHRHDYEELLLGIEGQLEHFIDFKSTIIDAPYISFITKGKVHRAKPLIYQEKCKIWIIRFLSEFIPETTFQLYSLYHDNANFCMQPGIHFDRLVTLCEIMHTEMQQPAPDYAVIRQLLSTVFTMIASERRKQNPEEEENMSAQSETFINFLKILEENFRRNKGVEFYAEKLFMSARNLNNISHQFLQQSVSEIIETRKLIEAKNLLSSTQKNISEIGFELGYNDKAYFTNVFKKRTGQTPSEFRKEVKKAVS